MTEGKEPEYNEDAYCEKCTCPSGYKNDEEDGCRIEVLKSKLKEKDDKIKELHELLDAKTEQFEDKKKQLAQKEKELEAQDAKLADYEEKLKERDFELKDLQLTIEEKDKEIMEKLKIIAKSYGENQAIPISTIIEELVNKSPDPKPEEDGDEPRWSEPPSGSKNIMTPIDDPDQPEEE